VAEPGDADVDAVADAQAAEDAGALADAQKAPFSSGPLPPPELPDEMRA
jgi:hypothetical protein